MKKSIKINGMDSYKTWGVFLANGNISSLMAPPQVKEYVSNVSNIEDGTRVITSEPPKLSERNVRLELWMKASSWEDYLGKYSSFVTELMNGPLLIQHESLPVVYNMLYSSCVEFRQFDGRLAKFVLSLREPFPVRANGYA